jgi:hypothetical protein
MIIVRMWRRLRGVRLECRSSSYGKARARKVGMPNWERATHYGLLPDIIIPVHKDVSPNITINLILFHFKPCLCSCPFTDEADAKSLGVRV